MINYPKKGINIGNEIRKNSFEVKTMKKILKRLLIVVLILAALIVLVTKIIIPIYASNYYISKFDLKEYSTDIEISIIESDDGYKAYFFDGYGEDTALIFYPGALVQTESYGELMAELASSGIDCYLIDAPYYMAILEPKAAKHILEDYQDNYENWYVGGHSMGGVIASKYASYHSDDLDGLILLASYSIDDLTETDLSVLSIYGSNDQVLDIEAYEENKVNLGSDLEEYVIEGGNHAGFAEYGEQTGDGKLEIDNQIEITSEKIAKFIESNVE